MKDNIILIKDVNTPDWDIKLQEKLVLVDFWAPWCQPCMVQEPLLVQLADEFPNITFLKLNIDDNRYLSQKLGVRNIPTLIFYKNGEEVKRFNGIQSKEVLSTFLNSKL